jgi:hypothetical protein
VYAPFPQKRKQTFLRGREESTLIKGENLVCLNSLLNITNEKRVFEGVFKSSMLFYNTLECTDSLGYSEVLGTMLLE